MKSWVWLIHLDWVAQQTWKKNPFGRNAMAHWQNVPSPGSSVAQNWSWGQVSGAISEDLVTLFALTYLWTTALLASNTIVLQQVKDQPKNQTEA